MNQWVRSDRQLNYFPPLLHGAVKEKIVDDTSSSSFLSEVSGPGCKWGGLWCACHSLVCLWLRGVGLCFLTLCYEEFCPHVLAMLAGFPTSWFVLYYVLTSSYCIFNVQLSNIWMMLFHWDQCSELFDLCLFSALRVTALHKWIYEDVTGKTCYGKSCVRFANMCSVSLFSLSI